MWTWKQAAGDLLHDGKFIAAGYSGRGVGVNNPAMQHVRAVGPVPRGKWKIGAPYNSPAVGPYALRLIAQDGNVDDVHSPTGRSAFRIHGDNRAMNRTASHGCIILPRAVREMIWNSGDHDLEVVA